MGKKINVKLSHLCAHRALEMSSHIHLAISSWLAIVISHFFLISAPPVHIEMSGLAWGKEARDLRHQASSVRQLFHSCVVG